MPTRLCSDPTCPEPAVYRGRCATHARHNEQATNRAGHHVYRTARWKHTREAVLADQPLCACGCGHISEHVDHIKPIDPEDPAYNPYDRANLQALAASCHSRKTRSEQVQR